MRRLSGQSGAGLLMLIGITAVLAILASSLVMLLSNQQHASARERSTKTSMDYAEAALNSAIAAVKTSDVWLTDPSLDVAAYASLVASLDDNYGTLDPPGPAETYRLYDDVTTVTSTTADWDQNNNNKLWVQVTVTYQGRTTRLRQMVASTTASVISKLPKAAAFVGGPGTTDDLIMTGSADVYVSNFSTWPATNANGVPYTGGAPFPTSIMAKRSISGQNATDLAYGSGRAHPQSLGAIYGTGGSVSLPAFNTGTPLVKSQGNVPDLTAYLSLSDQLNLEKEARSITDAEWQTLLNSAKVDARPADARPGDERPVSFTTPAYTTKALLLAACAYNATTKTYTASTDLYYNNTTTALQLNDAGTTYVFKSLNVNGSLAVSSTAKVTTTALRVAKTLSVSSTGTTNSFGPTSVVGATTISGSSTNIFGALWVDDNLSLSGTGTTNASTLHVGKALTVGSTVGANTFGSTYVIGDFSTSAGATSTTTFGPLWVDGKVTLGGSGNTTATTLRVVGAGGLAINSTTGTNDFGGTATGGSAYITGPLTTAATSSSPNKFGALWVDGGVTLNGSAATTSSSLHVGGALSINNTVAITNSFGSTWVVGAFNTPSTCRSTSHFFALWVDGGVTLNGLTTTNSTALHVGGNFIISGPTSVNTFGPIFAIGYVDWEGAATVKTTDWTDSNVPAADPAPMWIGGHDGNNVGFDRTGGPYNDEYGDVFVVFRVTWASTGVSTVNCPLFATTEMITTSGAITFGTMVTDVAHPDPRPMTLYMVCDNDGYYTQTCDWGSTGQFYGLMILFEAGITISNGNPAAPAVVGSVLTIGGDNGLRLQNNAQVAYCQDVVDWVFFPTVATTTVTQTVPGTWQELSANSP